MKRTYHTFKRILPDAGPDDPPWTLKALVKPGTAIVLIRLTEAHIQEALNRRGVADGQNCAGAICIHKHRNAFAHPTMPLVDWWYNRAYVCESINRKTGKAVCRAYAHYDDIAELFDGTQTDLEKLLKRVRKAGYIEITLYPVVRGKHPRTGVVTRPSGSSGDSGKEHQPRAIGAELRVLTHMRSFNEVTKNI